MAAGSASWVSAAFAAMLWSVSLGERDSFSLVRGTTEVGVRLRAAGGGGSLRTDED